MAKWRMVIGNGPCKGETYVPDFDEPAPTTFECKGASYFATEVYDGQYLALTVGSAKPDAYQAPAETAPEPVPLDAGLAGAWDELRRVIGHRIPDAVTDSARLRRKIRAAGRR